MHANPHIHPVLSADVDLLREVLERRWSDFVPSGPVSYAPPPEDDGEGDGAGSDDGGGGGSAGGEGEGDGEGEDDGGDEDGDGDGDGSGDDRVAKLESRLDESHDEVRGLKRRLSDSEKARKKAERLAESRKAGETDQVKEYQERAEVAEAEVEKLRTEIRSGAFNGVVLDVATRLRFKNPSMAHKLVDADLRTDAVDDDGEVDESLVERALKRIARDEPYLVNEAERPQGEVGGDRSQRRTSRSNGDKYEFDPRKKMRDHRRVPVGSRSGGRGED